MNPTSKHSVIGVTTSMAAALAFATTVFAQPRVTLPPLLSELAPNDGVLELEPLVAVTALRTPDRGVAAPSGGFDQTQQSSLQQARYAHRADLVAEVARRRPIFSAKDVSHVASGVALRNRSSGHIQTRGVPSSSTVVQSFLFWNLSDDQVVGATSMPLLFNGNLVRGRKTADNTEPCWGNAGNHSYVALVTPFTNQTGGPNQDYEVVLPFSLNTSTSGQNPWSPTEAADVRLEGATLVVVFSNSQTRGPLSVFAPAGDNMFFFNASYTFPTPGVGTGLLTAFGADGQRGSGHSDFLSGEVTTFVSGGPAIDLAGGTSQTGSDWDGDDGLTLPQLWDTHTHVVTFGGPQATVRYSSPGDCVVPVGFVLDQE